MMKKVSFILFMIALFIKCASKEPEAIDIHKDKCEFCKMSISDLRFACQMVTSKGRIYKFDDVLCANGYLQANKDKADSEIWICAYNRNNALIQAQKAYFIESDSLRSPMGGDVAAFKSETDAIKHAALFNAKLILWDNVKTK